MACNTPRDCGECAGCKHAEMLREWKLDKVHSLVEQEVAKYRDRVSIDDLDWKDYLDQLGAAVTNELVSRDWLKMELI